MHHFPDFFSWNGIFYKQLVASGNSSGISGDSGDSGDSGGNGGGNCAADPAFHAPEARMTVVHTQTPSNRIGVDVAGCV